MCDKKVFHQKSVCSKRKRSKTEPTPLPTRSQSQRKTRMKESPDNEVCGICLENVKVRGLLSSCDHVFCFACIHKWSKRCSTCPHCKREFKNITRLGVNGTKRDIGVRKRSLRDTLDREEFQQRRQQIERRMNNRVGQVQNLTQVVAPAQMREQLVAVQQVLAENMRRVSTGLQGLQDNLNSLVFLNMRQPTFFPLNLSLCNISFPPVATNINVTVNGRNNQPFNMALNGYGMQQNFHQPISQFTVDQIGNRFPNPNIIQQNFPQPLQAFSRTGQPQIQFQQFQTLTQQTANFFQHPANWQH